MVIFVDRLTPENKTQTVHVFVLFINSYVSCTASLVSEFFYDLIVVDNKDVQQLLQLMGMRRIYISATKPWASANFDTDQIPAKQLHAFSFFNNEHINLTGK